MLERHPVPSRWRGKQLCEKGVRMYGNGPPIVGGGVLGVGLARTGFPLLGFALLALAMILGGLLLLRAGMRRGL